MADQWMIRKSLGNDDWNDIYGLAIGTEAWLSHNVDPKFVLGGWTRTRAIKAIKKKAGNRYNRTEEYMQWEQMIMLGPREGDSQVPTRFFLSPLSASNSKPREIPENTLAATSKFTHR